VAGLGAGPGLPWPRRGGRREATPRRRLDLDRLAPGRPAGPLLAALLPPADPRRGDRRRRCARGVVVRPEVAGRNRPSTGPLGRVRRARPDARYRLDGGPSGPLLPRRPAVRTDDPLQ